MTQATAQPEQLLQAFIDNSRGSQVLWALQDPASEDWVVCDSLDFEQTDVMPFWSSEAAAKAYCGDEWQEYQAVTISIGDYLEFWVNNLNDDGVLVGLDWQADEETSVEVDPIVLAKGLADYEKA